MNEDEILGILRQLVEGRLQPQDWLAWWEANHTHVKAVTKPGHFMRMKPRKPPAGYDWTPLTLADGCVEGACLALDSAGVSYSRDESLSDQARRDSERLDREAMTNARNRQQQKRTEQLDRLSAIEELVPQFCQHVRRTEVDFRIDLNDDGISAVTVIEDKLGASLPSALRRLLISIKHLEIDGFRLGHSQLFWHPFGRGDRFVCFGAYFLRSDGDQLLFCPGTEHEDLVYYYAHEESELGISAHSEDVFQLLDGLPSEYLK